MKIAHFAQYAPNSSGQYATVKDLLLAERKIGLDAEFIDFGYRGSNESRVGLPISDNVETVHPDWANDADVLLMHSAIPARFEETKIPIVVCLHGRPENTFLLGCYQSQNIFEMLVKKKDRLAGFITFWDELVFQWETILDRVVHYVPTCVDLETYKPDGSKHEFKPSGNPNIIITDMWREDITPFNMIMNALYFRKKYQPEAKLHIYGLSNEKKKWLPFIDRLQASGALGEVLPQISGLKYVYRAADMLITPHKIATRVIREALACGLPIVAGEGCSYTNFKCDSRNMEEYASVMNDLYTVVVVQYNATLITDDFRNYAIAKFNPLDSAKMLKTTLEKIL